MGSFELEFEKWSLPKLGATIGTRWWSRVVTSSVYPDGWKWIVWSLPQENSTPILLTTGGESLLSSGFGGKPTGELVLKKGKANLSLVGEIGPELEHPGFSLANPEWNNNLVMLKRRKDQPVKIQKDPHGSIWGLFVSNCFMFLHSVGSQRTWDVFVFVQSGFETLQKGKVWTHELLSFIVSILGFQG